ncbi:MAG TPA: hypothetical protein VH639_21885 [Bryobacteraceae bacterium]
MPRDFSANTEAVHAEVAKIAASAGFAKSERITRFLQFIVEETLAGRGDNIKEYLIGVEVYGRAENYDPRIDAIVRVEATKLRKRLGQYYEGEGREDALVVTVPKGSYRPEFERRNGQTHAPPHAPDFRRAFFAGAAALLVALAATGVWWMRSAARTPRPTHQRLISTFEGSHSAASFSPGGTMIAFIGKSASADDAETAQVWVKDLAEGRPIQITYGGTGALRPIWSPRGDQILFERAGQGLWSVPPLGGSAHRIVEDGRAASLSADGSRLLFVRQRAIWVARADGISPRRLAGVPERFFPMETAPAFSPDGRMIAFFNAAVGPLGDIWVIPSEGGRPRQITFDHVETRGLTWSSDSRWIVFSSARAGSFTLWRAPASGGAAQPLTSGAGEDIEPAISADGKRLIYTNARTSWSLATLDPASQTQKELFTQRETIGFPSFSPDGSRIAFFEPVDGDPHLFVVGADGIGRRQITRGDGQEILPAWSKDGSFIYFYTVKPELSFRKLAVAADEVTQVTQWAYGQQNWAQVDPWNRAAVYTSVGPKGPLVTFVRDLKTGEERPLPLALSRQQWSPDGRFIMGETGNRGSVASRVAMCRAVENECREIADGLAPKWSSDGRRIYFLRPADRADWFDLWFASSDGSNGRKISTIGPFRADLIGFDVAPDGRIIWAPSREGRRELWLADLD